MKIRYAMALAIAVGLGLGVIGARGFAAQAKRSVYVVTEVDAITDTDSYKAIMKMDPANVAEAKYVDGRYLASNEKIIPLDGTAPKAIVIIAFDNVVKAKAYYDNTKEIAAMRMKATKSRSFIVEGPETRFD
jgi:uncharacterized protein (DUF1330 family)